MGSSQSDASLTAAGYHASAVRAWHLPLAAAPHMGMIEPFIGLMPSADAGHSRDAPARGRPVHFSAAVGGTFA